MYRLLGIARDEIHSQIHVELTTSKLTAYRLTGILLMDWKLPPYTVSCTPAVQLCPRTGPTNLFHGIYGVRVPYPSTAALTRFTIADFSIVRDGLGIGVYGHCTLRYELITHILDFSVDAPVQAMMILSKMKRRFLQSIHTVFPLLAALCCTTPAVLHFPLFIAFV